MAAAAPDDATVTVLVVDDHAPFLAAACTVVDRCGGFRVVAMSATGEDAVERAAALHPALVLMDLHLPGIDGVEATRRILDAAPDTVVVVCSTYEPSQVTPAVRTCGAAAYLHKEELGPAMLRRLWDELGPNGRGC